MDWLTPHHQARDRDYLWRARWGIDANGRWCRWRFGPTAHTQAAKWRQDPSFPRDDVCALLEDPAVDLLSPVVDALLPETFTGELDLVREALELACAVEEGNAWGVVAGVAGVVLAVTAIAYATSRDQGQSGFGGGKRTSLVRAPRPPRSLTRASRR